MGNYNSAARAGDVFFILTSVMVIMTAAITVTKLIVRIQDVSFFRMYYLCCLLLTANIGTPKTLQTCSKLSILPDCNKLVNFIKLQQVY